MTMDLFRVAQSATKTKTRLFLYLNERKDNPVPYQLPKEGEDVRMLHVPYGIDFRIVFINGEFAIGNATTFLYCEGMPWGVNHALVKKLIPVAKVIRGVMGLTPNDNSAVLCIYGVVKFGGDVVIYDAMDILEEWPSLSRHLRKDDWMVEKAWKFRLDNSRHKEYWSLEDVKAFVADVKQHEESIGFKINYAEDMGRFPTTNVPTNTEDIVKWARDVRDLDYEDFVKPESGTTYLIWTDRSKMFRIIGSVYYWQHRMPPAYISPKPGRRLEDYLMIGEQALAAEAQASFYAAEL